MSCLHSPLFEGRDKLIANNHERRLVVEVQLEGIVREFAIFRERITKRMQAGNLLFPGSGRGLRAEHCGRRP